MKLAALLFVSLIWLLLFFLANIHLKFFYSFRNYKSEMILDCKILFSHLKVELNLPKEMLSEGFRNIFSNIIEDISTEGKGEKQEKEQADPKESHRYRALTNYIKEIFRHYVVSWSRWIWLRRKISSFIKYFYRKVHLYSLNAAVEVGGRDAAETGLMAGAFWSFFGLMSARLYRLVTVKKNKIHYNVIPRFDEQIFFCKLNCILSLKISHIIFTGYKFLLFISKNRRVRNYGRTPD